MKKLVLAAGLLVLFLVYGTLFFSHIEGWSKTDAFYFSTMTLTTVGYGDLTPTTDQGKIAVSIYAVLGIGVMVTLLGWIVNHIFRLKL